MKRLLALCALLFTTSAVYAASLESSIPVSVSSYTATNETKARLGTTKAGDILETVVIGKASASGVLTIYDGQGTNSTAIIAQMDMATVQNANFFVKVSSGLSYTTASNSSGVTLIYRQR